MNMWYKNDEIGVFKQIDIRDCGYDCSLGDFGQTMRKYLVDVETWKDECNVKVLSQPISSTSISYFFGIITQVALKRMNVEVDLFKK